MEIITSLDKNSFGDLRTGVALGNFDGVHIGHQTPIVNLVDICREAGLKSVIYAFRNHPRNLTRDLAPQKIITDEQKFRILREMGIDYLYFIDFNEYHRTLEPEKFIRDILVEKLNMSHVVVGFDYRFGFKAKGDVVLLDQLKNQYSYDCTIIEPISIQGETISSTGIRKLIAQGNVNKANLFLGRRFSIIGEVVKGKGLGKKFGFPTANISISEKSIIPSPGVYITKCLLDSKIYNSITSVGVNPTIGDNPITIESHIFDNRDDFYGANLEILFYHKIREEIKFDNVDNLINQVNKDIVIAKNFFSN